MHWIGSIRLSSSQRLSQCSIWTRTRHLGTGAIALFASIAVASAIATPAQAEEEHIWPNEACPEDVEPLTGMLLRDLPAYTNRVLLRAYGRSPGDLDPDIRQDPNRIRYLDTRQPGIVIIAGIPEFDPLTLGPGLYQPDKLPNEAELDSEAPEQIFFTTLERQYLRYGETEEIQQFHWLFLARTSERWYVSQLFSSWGGYPNGQPPTAPEDVTYSAIAQAIRLWLDDCAAGSVAPL